MNLGLAMMSRQVEHTRVQVPRRVDRGRHVNTISSNSGGKSLIVNRTCGK